MSHSANSAATAALRRALLRLTVPLVLALVTTPASAAERTITSAGLRTAIEGYWIGQLAGNSGLPNFNRISDIVDRILAIAEKEILANGGGKTSEGPEAIYTVKADF